MNSFEYEIKETFLIEAKELLTSTEKCFLNLEKNPNDVENLNLIFRLAHNIKGSSGVAGFIDLAEFTHNLESLLLALKEGQCCVTPAIIDLLLRVSDYLNATIETLSVDHKASCANPELTNDLLHALKKDHDYSLRKSAEVAGQSTIEGLTLFSSEPVVSIPQSAPTTCRPKDENIRVNISRIESLLNNVGELSILQAVMVQQSKQLGSELPQLMRSTMSSMSKIIKETQSISMRLRMLPIKQVFHKMERIVRDTSKALGKDVQLHLSGEETEVDKTVLEQLSDPLVHMVRNAVDHGIESAVERIESGKNPKGNIFLSASYRAGQIAIEIRDDGKGLDPECLTSQAKSKGVISADAVLTPEQAYQLIFKPGFSTKQNVTDISGRGVGMDVVKTNISALQGQIDIETTLKQGTCLRVVLPLTMAIIDSVLVNVGKERYVVPISQISEFFRPQESDVNLAYDCNEILTIRDESLAVFRMANLIRRSHVDTTIVWNQTALIIRDTSTNCAFAVMVDRVVAQQQVVIKPLGNEVKNRPGVMGSAILGDGRPALILDLHELIKSVVAHEPTAILSKPKVRA